MQLLVRVTQRLHPTKGACLVCLVGLAGCSGGSATTDVASAVTEEATSVAAPGLNVGALAGQPIQRITTFANDTETRELRVFDPDSAVLLLAAQDSDLDGVDDLTQIFEYDDNDCNTTEESFDADNLRLSRIAYERRADCGFLSRTEDSGPTGSDGIADRIVRQEFDADDRISLIQTDNSGDGIFDRIEQLSYDSAGNILTRELDFDGDGTIDSRRSFEYEAGEVVLETLDSNGDGIIERTLTAQRTSTALGAICATTNCQRIVSIDEDNDGVVDTRQLFEHDEAGNELRWLTLYELDGTHAGQETVRVFNANNQVTRVEIDVDGDGIFERSRDFSYNADNNPLEVIFQQEGVETFRESYVYEDWTIGQLD